MTLMPNCFGIYSTSLLERCHNKPVTLGILPSPRTVLGRIVMFGQNAGKKSLVGEGHEKSICSLISCFSKELKDIKSCHICSNSQSKQRRQVAKTSKSFQFEQVVRSKLQDALDRKNESLMADGEKSQTL